MKTIETKSGLTLSELIGEMRVIEDSVPRDGSVTRHLDFSRCIMDVVDRALANTKWCGFLLVTEHEALIYEDIKDAALYGKGQPNARLVMLSAIYAGLSQASCGVSDFTYALTELNNL